MHRKNISFGVFDKDESDDDVDINGYRFGSVQKTAANLQKMKTESFGDDDGLINGFSSVNFGRKNDFLITKQAANSFTRPKHINNIFAREKSKTKQPGGQMTKGGGIQLEPARFFAPTGFVHFGKQFLSSTKPPTKKQFDKLLGVPLFTVATAKPAKTTANAPAGPNSPVLATTHQMQQNEDKQLFGFGYGNGTSNNNGCNNYSCNHEQNYPNRYADGNYTLGGLSGGESCSYSNNYNYQQEKAQHHESAAPLPQYHNHHQFLSNVNNNGNAMLMLPSPPTSLPHASKLKHSHDNLFVLPLSPPSHPTSTTRPFNLLGIDTSNSAPNSNTDRNNSNISNDSCSYFTSDIYSPSQLQHQQRQQQQQQQQQQNIFAHPASAARVSVSSASLLNLLADDNETDALNFNQPVLNLQSNNDYYHHNYNVFNNNNYGNYSNSSYQLLQKLQPAHVAESDSFAPYSLPALSAYIPAAYPYSYTPEQSFKDDLSLKRCVPLPDSSLSASASTSVSTSVSTPALTSDVPVALRSFAIPSSRVTTRSQTRRQLHESHPQNTNGTISQQPYQTSSNYGYNYSQHINIAQSPLLQSTVANPSPSGFRLMNSALYSNYAGVSSPSVQAAAFALMYPSQSTIQSSYEQTAQKIYPQPLYYQPQQQQQQQQQPLQQFQIQQPQYHYHQQQQLPQLGKSSGLSTVRLAPLYKQTATEVIDLTRSESPAIKKRRIDLHVSSSLMSIPGPLPLPVPQAYSGGLFISNHERALHQQPSIVAPLVECDDKDGHYIVREGDDLTPQFKIIRLLGQGTFGKVVEAYDRQRNIKVAIKIIRSIQKYRDAAKIEVRVLNALKKNDPQNLKRCIHLMFHFEHRNHTCMVFELLAQSIFDFLKENSFSPFPVSHIQSFAHQIIDSITFMHNLRLIHTDLKPENLMLENIQCRPVLNRTTPRELLSARLRLIDFGSAIFDNDYHSSVVSTRHYRAPEIILGTGWSFPCDMWSIGCILVEFFTGDALFQTHDNVEHLAMMQAVLGPMPDYMIRSISPDKPSAKFFKSNRQVNWPLPQTSKATKKFVKTMRPLNQIIPATSETTQLFLDLVKQMLVYDPKMRITAKEALQHPFLRHTI
ncbi:dual specificity protein kinase kns1, partial [Physocladia obscura]